MSLDIFFPKKRYVCIGTDFSNKELYASIDKDELKIGEIYDVEASMSGIYWYIYDKVGNYIAVVRHELIEKNFVLVKGQGRLLAPLSPNMHSDSYPVHHEEGKFICTNECETRPSTNLYYTLLPKKFVVGRTYNIKLNEASPLLRYIYEDGPTLENYIGCVDKSFVDDNFVPRNEEYNTYIEIENIFDKLFFEK